MSTGEINPKIQLNASISAASSSSSPSAESPSNVTTFYDEKPTEKFYKKEKQILIEFDQIVRGKNVKKNFVVFISISLSDIRFQLNEQLKCLEQRIDTQLAIVTEIQEYFRRRADVELDYAKNLDNLHKQIGQKHRTQKAR